MKKYILLLLFFVWFVELFSQTNDAAIIYAVDPASIHNSLIGLQPDYTVIANNEHPFSNIKISKQNLRFIAPLPHNAGLCLDLMHQQRGVFNQLQFLAAYAYHIKLKPSLFLNFSLLGYYLDNSMYETNLSETELNDPAVHSFILNRNNDYGTGFATSVKSLCALAGASAQYSMVQKQLLWDATLGYDLYFASNFVLTPYLKAKNTAIEPLVGGVLLSAWYNRCLGISAETFYHNTSQYGFSCFLSNRLFVGYSYVINSYTNTFQNTHRISLGLKLGNSAFNGLFSSSNQNKALYDWNKK